MSLNKMKRPLGAVVLIVVLSLAAVPALAADQPEDQQAGLPGFFDRMVTSAADGLDDWMQSVWASMTGTPTGPLNGEGGYLDPNGGPKPGCETTPQGCTTSGGS